MSRAEAQAILDKAARRLLDEELATEAVTASTGGDLDSLDGGPYEAALFVRGQDLPVTCAIACPDCGGECEQRPDGSWECRTCGTVL